ncbi:hypothetical protein LH464_23870 [Neorhizobium sp. T786]|uniref:hypothetical protein n=1 Tax=Pseudorhizobium xiangyangii TaxID=2883104 RepID=UPI001CFFDD93|nr:hypothetical protein [Neorhizobium xiangyangii]MCB5205487.1 hypothetical protein [Neorhizobium xiangyangii]
MLYSAENGLAKNMLIDFVLGQAGLNRRDIHNGLTTGRCDLPGGSNGAIMEKSCPGIWEDDEYVYVNEELFHHLPPDYLEAVEARK